MSKNIRLFIYCSQKEKKMKCFFVIISLLWQQKYVIEHSRPKSQDIIFSWPNMPTKYWCLSLAHFSLHLYYDSHVYKIFLSYLPAWAVPNTEIQTDNLHNPKEVRHQNMSLHTHTHTHKCCKLPLMPISLFFFAKWLKASWKLLKSLAYNRRTSIGLALFTSQQIFIRLLQDRISR